MLTTEALIADIKKTPMPAAAAGAPAQAAWAGMY